MRHPGPETARDRYRIKLCFRPDGSSERYAAVFEAALALRPELRPAQLDRSSDYLSPTDPWTDARWAEVAELCASTEPRSWTLWTAERDAIIVSREAQQVVVEIAIARGAREPADELAELLDRCGERNAPALGMAFDTDNKADAGLVWQGLDNLADLPPVCFVDWTLVAALGDAEPLRALPATRAVKGGLLAVVRPVFGKPSKPERGRSKLIASALGLPRSFVGVVAAEPADEEVLVQFWPEGSQGSFTGVQSSAIAAWLVGEHGQIARWSEDAEWQLVESGSDATLRAVAAGGEQHAVAVGDDGEILEWNGDVWSRSTSLATGSLLAVHASSEASAVAVGSSGTIVRLTEGSCHAEPSGTTADLTGVSGSWIVGARGTILVRRDNAWQRLEAPVDGDLHAVSSLGDEAWAVGDGGQIFRLERDRAIRVDSGVTVTLRGVSSFARDNVWAVGDGCTILHWNGQVWSPLDSETNERLHAVAAIDERHAWVVGERMLVLRATLR